MSSVELSSQAPQAIHYDISAADCLGHYFDICLHIANPDPEGQIVRLPAWLPGSYMIRDFAKNVIEFAAYHGQQTLAVMRIDKQTWQIQGNDGPIQIHYRVYAWDLSVRTAYLDDQFGFYNHSALCLEVVGQHDQACTVQINLPEHLHDWSLATGMPRLQGDAFASGLFSAANYAELIDYPVLMGSLTLEDFIVQGVRHRIALAGQHYADMERIAADLAKICALQLDLFADTPPFNDYTFLVIVTGDGFGGLEHRNSTALICARDDLVQLNGPSSSDGYRTFLSLCSHEYLHSWNIKRLRPREFIPFHLDQEQYTEQLWFYEGVTSYYDDLFVHRAGLSTRQQYLAILSSTFTRALLGKGPQRQSLTLSSQLAWTTFYQQNENAPNAIASYYSKGAITALGIDLILRKYSQASCGLDDVMRQLWVAYGRDERGTTMDSLIDTIIELVGKQGEDEMRRFLQRALFTTQPLHLEELLTEFGIAVELQALSSDNGPFGKPTSTSPTVALGARFKDAVHYQGLELVQVYEHGTAYHAGLSAGDVIIAVDNLAVTSQSLARTLSRYNVGQKSIIHAFRRDQLSARTLVWQAPELNNWVLTEIDASQADLWLQAT